LDMIRVDGNFSDTLNTVDTLNTKGTLSDTFDTQRYIGDTNGTKGIGGMKTGKQI